MGGGRGCWERGQPGREPQNLTGRLSKESPGSETRVLEASGRWTVTYVSCPWDSDIKLTAAQGQTPKGEPYGALEGADGRGWLGWERALTVGPENTPGGCKWALSPQEAAVGA